MSRQNKGRAKKVYRLNLSENSTHKTIRIVKFTLPSFIIICVSSIVAIILLLYCLIALTPLRSTIPGYPDAHSKKVALENAIKIDSLENAITRWHYYVANLRNVLNGEATISPDSLIRYGSSPHYLSDKSEKELALRDSLLRETVHKEEQFGVSNSASRQLPAEGINFFPPVKGVVTTTFDSVLHPGADISTAKGAIVSSVLDGTVIQRFRTDIQGWVIVIQHRNNIVSIYSNLERSFVSTSDSVTGGRPIGISGNSSGSQDSYHLHLELWQDGQALNPSNYI